MADIKESRLLRIDGRIVTTGDLRRLANALSQEHKAWIKENRHVRLSFTANASDGSVFESEDPGLFSDESPITSRRVVSVEMNLRAYDVDRSVNIDLRQTERYGSYRNPISCKGSDSTWVNGMLATLQDIVDGFEPQNQFVRNNRRWIQVITAIGIGAVVVTVVSELLSLMGLRESPSDNALRVFLQQNPIVRLAVLYFLYWIAGSFPASYLIDRLEDLWPRVEFQVGPPHKQVERRKRSVLAAVVILGVIPFVLQLISDVIQQLRLLGG